ncbi:MAG: PQQ-binding-like beta-propeller repeat protein [Bacteroidia bacterium]|nr:PQQ-binding-like beta-propeller repeat protein [Bacteroidia bacterium]
MRKKILYLTLAAGLILQGCADTLPRADFSLFQAESVSAVAGDGSVVLSWTLQSGKPAPLEFYVSWVAGSPSGEDGEMTLPSSQTSLTVDKLVNDCAYTFCVQGRYEKGLSQKVSATCTPKSTRIAASAFRAMAGDGRIYATWTPPDTKLDYSYRLSVYAEGRDPLDIQVASSETSRLIDGLSNGTEYRLTLVCVYAHGESPSVETSATPGMIDPITVTSSNLIQFQLCSFEYNPAYFIQGDIESVMWEFGDGAGSSADKALYCYPEVGNYTASITVTYKGGKSETATIDITVSGFLWTTVGGTGYQKASHIVFSPDGQTLYSATTANKLVAIDAIMGTIVWEFATGAVTYGAGPAVGADGTVYFGTEDSEGTLYAVSASGAQKWKKALGAAVKASPAVTGDGMLYALSNAGVLYALDASSGTEKWTGTLEGTASGVVVGSDGTVYAATSKGIWAYSASGQQIWQSADAHNVTERGGSLAIWGDLLYATLKKGGGCVAVNLADGTTRWKDAKTSGDCYHPVVDAEGTVYFCEKGGYLYATRIDGTAKWEDKTDKNYIYSGFAIASDGKAYIAQYASPFNLLSFGLSGTREVVTNIGVQVMSPVSIGPDRRAYYGTNGSVSAYDIRTSLMDGGWPVRGGNLQGTNSLK